MKIEQEEIQKMTREELLEWVIVFLDELSIKYKQLREVNELLK